MAHNTRMLFHHLLRCFVCWLAWHHHSHQTTNAQQTTIKVEECTGDGMKLRIGGPFYGDVLVNQQLACRLPVGLLDDEHMSFLVPYGDRCGLRIDEDGKAIANLAISERSSRSSASSSAPQLRMLTCQYSVSKRVVPPSTTNGDAEREKLDDPKLIQQHTQLHTFWPNNVESDKITIAGINLGLDKRVDLVGPQRVAHDDHQSNSVYLNRDRSYARSVSVKMTPDPQILEQLHRKMHQQQSQTDNAGFVRVSRRINVKAPDLVAA